MTTEIGMIGVIVFLVALEAWSIVNKRPGDMISQVTWRVSYRKPFIVFLTGFLCGHLFWQSEACQEILMRVPK